MFSGSYDFPTDQWIKRNDLKLQNQKIKKFKTEIKQKKDKNKLFNNQIIIRLRQNIPNHMNDQWINGKPNKIIINYK